MAPTLSPGKTWEGAVGGLLGSAVAFIVVALVGRDLFGNITPFDGITNKILKPLGFALSVGLAGMLGDLAESMIKRDCQQKDASQIVPGFGGVLDVVDSVIFAAPVAYLWFFLLRP